MLNKLWIGLTFILLSLSLSLDAYLFEKEEENECACFCVTKKWVFVCEKERKKWIWQIEHMWQRVCDREYVTESMWLELCLCKLGPNASICIRVFVCMKKRRREYTCFKREKQRETESIRVLKERNRDRLCECRHSLQEESETKSKKVFLIRFFKLELAWLSEK